MQNGAVPTRRERLLTRLINVYPPYLGAGVRVLRSEGDERTFRVEMRLRPWNRNLFGTHFGGSLYSMADPFFMLILIDALGHGFEVWDKSAAIRFRRPGRGTVRARFEIPAERIEEIRREAERNGRCEPVFLARVEDGAGEAVAEVEKTVSVRRRER